MNILSTQSLKLPEVKTIRFGRFQDRRGYFTEHFRKSDFNEHPLTDFMKGIEFVQANESFSKAGTIRGLHFQWNPLMGKLVRVLSGRMLDLVMDIRKGSPTFGRIIAHDMPSRVGEDSAEWIWVPPGFAHGNVFPEDTLIEYFCSGEYSAGCEAVISPLASDIDWSLCDKDLKNIFDTIAATTALITEKDRGGLSVSAWSETENSNNFIY